MRREVGGVDLQTIGFPALSSKLGKDAVEQSQAAPANRTIVERLMRTIGSRCIGPAQPVPDHDDDAANDPPVIDPRDAARQRNCGSIRRVFGSPNIEILDSCSACLASPSGQAIPASASDLVGPEPNKQRPAKGSRARQPDQHM